MIKKNIFKSLVAVMLTLTATACTNSDDEPNYDEITLTTPVVQLADVQATVTRGTAVTSYDGMTLKVELLTSDGTSTNRSAEYSYNDSQWTCENPLTVTGGEGNYNARVLASNVDVGEVKGAFYKFEGQIDVNIYGTFTIGADDNDSDNDMKPLTAAIKVVLKDAAGNEIQSTDLSNYKVKMTGVQKVTSVSWGDTKIALNAADCTDNDNAIAEIYGYYNPTTIEASADLLTVTYTDSNNPLSPTTWKVINGDQQLALEAGKIHTFTITLGSPSSTTP